MNNLGERIKFLRESKHMTQKTLGDIVDLHGSNIGRIENGKVFPTSDVLLKIAICFEVSCDWLLTGEDAKTQMCENADEIDLIRLYKQLPPEDQIDIKEMIEFKLYKSKKARETNSKSFTTIDSNSMTG